MSEKLTKAQQLAVDTRGIPIVLSAAAGSGKTRVLTTRAFSSNIPLENQLIVTFTVDAAESMKEKIADMGLNTDASHIGTIDSLCNTIVKENIQKVNLPTNYRIGNDQELAEFRQEATAKALDEFYENGSDDFKKLLTIFCQKDDDSLLEDAIDKILTFAESNPESRNWLINQKCIFDLVNNDVSKTAWGKILLSYGETIINEAKSICRKEIEIIDENIDLEPYKAAIESDLDYVTNFPLDNWSSAYNYCQNFAAKTLARVTTENPNKELLQSQRANFKKLISDKLAKNVFCVDEREFLEDIYELAPLTTCLFDLTIRTYDLEKQAKEETGIVSFSDIEQYASEILQDEIIRKNYQNEFEEVLVDEFQDVNQVQFKIITSLTRDEKNLFVVGDVKQSIYRFRKADPRIFMSLIKKYKGKTSLMRLNDNFRSRHEVTDTVNLVFSKIMTEKYGEVCYNEDEKLNPKADYIEKPNTYNTEVYLVKEEKDENNEAKFVAQKIAELISSGVSASDIAVLVRNKNSISKFKQALEKLNIPITTRENEGFLEEKDIISSINILKAISNPTRDIEFFGLLVSPLFNFTDTDIAKIRVKDKKSSLYSCFIKASEEDIRIKKFLEDFNNLRTRSYILNPSEFIAELFPNPTANQSLLIEYADNFISEGIKTLDGFIRYLDKLREIGKDLNVAVTSVNKNSVTLSTIHKSKGLEWSYVFVCECDKKFGFRSHEMIDPVILNSDLGFACKKRNELTLIERPTLPMLALRAKAEESAISEEIRVFYVALTRAKQKLFITAKKENPESFLQKPNVEIRASRSYLDWIVLTLKDKLQIINEIEEKNNKFDIVKEKEITKKVENTFNYKFFSDTLVPSKMTVTELVGKNTNNLFKDEPQFISGKVNGATLGTILHEYLEKVDFNNPKDIPKELKYLKMREFFSGDIVKRIKESKKVLREFNMMAPHEYNGGETILQGIADLVIFDDDGIILVDYKTDKVSSENDLVIRYKGQLDLYSEMLERMFSLKVTEKIIYSFFLGKEIKC